MKREKSNPNLQNLILKLKILSSKENVPLWKRVAKELEKPTRKQREVNLYKIDKYTREKEVALVPGKILSEGELTKKIKVAAFKFSNKAREKIDKVGKAMTIDELIKENPKGNNVRILG